MVAGKEARLQLEDPVPALRQRKIRVTGETTLNPQLIKLLIVKAAKCRRQSPEGPDQPALSADVVDGETEPHLLRKRETTLDFAFRLIEWIARREKVRIQVVTAVRRKIQVAALVRGLERSAHQIT